MKKKEKWGQMISNNETKHVKIKNDNTNDESLEPAELSNMIRPRESPSKLNSQQGKISKLNYQMRQDPKNKNLQVI